MSCISIEKSTVLEYVVLILYPDFTNVHMNKNVPFEKIQTIDSLICWDLD